MMIGTDGSHETEYGGTTPAVGSPFAMTQWCAATRLNGISRTMYRRCDSVLIGFMGDAPTGHLDGRLRVHDPDAPKWRTENQGDGQAGASGSWERSGYTLLL